MAPLSKVVKHKYCHFPDVCSKVDFTRRLAVKRNTWDVLLPRSSSSFILEESGPHRKLSWGQIQFWASASMQVVPEAVELFIIIIIWTRNKRSFPTAVQGQVFENVHLRFKLCCAASHYIGSFCLRTHGLKCIWCPGTLAHEQHDKPQLSLTSKYGTGHIKWNLSSSHQPHLLLFWQAAVNICPLGGPAEITSAVQIQQLSVGLWPSPYIDLGHHFVGLQHLTSPWAVDSEPLWEGGSSQGAGGHWLQAPQPSSCVPFCLCESPPVLVLLMLPHILLISWAAQVPTVGGSMCCKMHTALRSSLSHWPYWFSPN